MDEEGILSCNVIINLRSNATIVTVFFLLYHTSYFGVSATRVIGTDSRDFIITLNSIKMLAFAN